MDFPDDLPILDAIKRKFPGKDNKWQSWAEIFEAEDVDTVGDVRVLTDEVWAGLKLTGLVRSALADLRGPAAAGGAKRDDGKAEAEAAEKAEREKAEKAERDRAATAAANAPRPGVAVRPKIAPGAGGPARGPGPAAGGGGGGGGAGKCGSCPCTSFAADPFKPTKCSNCFHVHGGDSGASAARPVGHAGGAPAADAAKERADRERQERERRERQPTTVTPKPNPTPAPQPKPAPAPAHTPTPAKTGGKPGQCPECDCVNFTPDAFRKTKCAQCFHNHPPAEGDAPETPSPAPGPTATRGGRGGGRGGRPPAESRASEGETAAPTPAPTGAVRGRGGAVRGRGGHAPVAVKPVEAAPEEHSGEAAQEAPPAVRPTPAVRGRGGGAVRGRGGMGGSPAPAPVAAPIVNVAPPAPVDDDDFEAEDRAEAARKEQQQQQEQEAREREEQQQREREEAERAEREQNERAERERNERADRERQQREKADREKKERADRERREKEQREKEQREREQREKEQREKEQREKEQQNAVTTNADGRQTWGDWEEMWDESSQCFYYDNLSTGVTSWDKPDGWPHGDVSPPDMAPLEPARPPSPQAQPAKDLGVCECGVPYHSELVAFCTECGIPKKAKEAPKPVSAPKAPAKVEKFAPKAPVKREEEAPIKVFCPECGTPFEGPQERFCSECGTPQPSGKGKVPGKVQLPSAPKSPEPAPRPPPGKKIPVSHSTLSNLDGALAAGLGGQAKNLDLSRVGDWQANQFAGSRSPTSPASNNHSNQSPPPASADSNSQAPEGKTTPVHSTLKSSIANTKKAGMLNKCPAAKKGDILRSGWKPRYFALQADTRFLSYWAGGGAYGAPTGTINLRQAECTVTDKAPNAFRLVENGRKYFYIQASTPESRDDWVASINAVIRPAGS